jgi:hypothetical protein
MKFKYTKHQTPRGSKPDGLVGKKMYLIKNVGEFRLTYQVRLLTYRALSEGMKLVIQLPKDAKVHASLRSFIINTDGLVKIERTT